MNDVASGTPVEFVFNNQQQAAMEDMVRWFQKNRRTRVPYSDEAAFEDVKVVFYLLQGFAGTGKTTLVKKLLEMLGIPINRIALVAPTNRAAKVLSNKTGLFTRTLFSLIYSSQREELDYARSRLRIWDEAANFSQLGDLLIQTLDSDPEEEFHNEWEESGYGAEYGGDYEGRDNAKQAALEKFVHGRREQILKYEGIDLPEDPAERLRIFGDMKTQRMKDHRQEIKDILAEDMPVRKRDAKDVAGKYDAIICDEASMVNKDQGRDVCSYGIPVIFVGDPFQLPPVKAKAFWDGLRAQSQLTKIERQKGPGAGIPLAGERLRNGLSIERNESVGIHKRGTKPEEFFLEADQILVGTHKTREQICRLVRRLRGYETAQPVKGEKVVAVYNDKEKGIMNGELYEVLDSELIRGGSVTRMSLKDPYGKIIDNAQAWTSGFPGRSKTDFLDEEFGKFWYGYAITCHQSQGSEWEHVIVCDDWPRGDKETYDRWLYTALTRASRRVEWIR
jgi:exodeoxyribonuclease-5